LIDEVRISAAALYSSNFSPGLGPANQTRAYWKFDGQTVNDFSGNGNHGTLQGGATYSTVVPPIGGSQRPVPVPGGPYNGQLGQPVQFSSSGSFDPDGTITAYHWNFGDGTTSNAANPTHTYQSSGLLTATLTVTDNAGLLASATASVSVNGSSEARLDPRNATGGGGGENPLSRNFNWSLPLVSLPGRAGLDLNLSLSYNSLVWTKKGTTLISFDDDYGFPSPGFRLGFPTIQTAYLNAETGKWSYLLIGSNGSRTELRRVTTSSVFYESADSSHLLLDTTELSSSDPKMILRTTDGTQLTYKPMGVAYECTEIKDRNGNYITINYNSSGRIANIHDTLDRTITFVYDNGWLTSIEQQWKKPSNPSQQITHTWASFAYANVPIQTNFTAGIAVSGPTNGTSVKMLTKVTLDDNSTTPSQNSHHDFEYTSWGQVWKISNFAADSHLLNYRSYNLPGSPLWLNPPAQSDCPRFTERRDWAEKWNQNISGTEQEAVTTYTEVQSGTASVPGNSQSATFVQVTNPDQTFTKIYFLGTAGANSGWQVGLPYLVDSYDVGGTTPQRQVATIWTQDDELKSYILNPRAKETNIYDSSGNRKRTETLYQSYALGNGMSCQLPQDVREYGGNATTTLRTTRTIYIDDSPYLSRRIIGLPKESLLYEGPVASSNLRSKREFKYDEAGSIDGNDAPVQHDPAYSSSFVLGRGNLSTVKRFNVDNLSEFTTSTMKYNTAGSVVSSKDALNHESKVSYADSFSDGVSRNTFAYPTKLTDAAGYYSTSKYNYDFGALTYQQAPPPNFTGAPSQQPAGPEQTFEYYDHGPLKKQLNLVNNAYTRFEYASSQIRVDTYATIQDNLGEAHSFKFTDGHGRVIATASDHPGSVGLFSGQKFVYNLMGRVIKTSNPTETSASGAPSQWATAGDDAAVGWIYTEHTYDWKGRPLVTTNQDGTIKTATYTGCGCAGGEVVTLTDEVGRQQKVYTDVLGRAWKTEILKWDSSISATVVYSARVRKYNARDQVTAANSYKGGATSDFSCPSGTCMQSVSTYDGYGRLATHKLPQQTTAGTYAYNADDTVQSVTDPRGVVATNSFNSRQLLTGVAYTPAVGVPALTSVVFDYDAAGNRKSMSDGSGTASYSYDQLSRMTSETKMFSGVAGSYTINYGYNISGLLTSVTDPSGAQVSYGYDSTGRLSSMPASGYAGVTNFLSSTQYRAAGAMKRATYGNGVQLDVNYNSRMQIGQYQVSNANFTAGASLAYYADGRTSTAFDLNDSRFDRKYEFDFSARLQEAYSGVEAHGAPAPPLAQANSPYRQTYSYDEWNNVTLRTGRIWSAQTEHEAVSYTSDNKASSSSYDAAGNITWANGGARTYDAAGRPMTFTSSQNWQVYPDWPSGNPDGPALETQDTFDGTGRVVKHVNHTRRDDTYDSGGGNLVYNKIDTTTITYYLHSSVLGKTIAHLDPSGNKILGYVYAGSTRVATQTISGSSNAVQFESTNPVTGATVAMDASGIYLAREEPDPLGRDLTNPPDPLIVTDPLSSEKWNEPMPLEYAAHWTGELESGMAQHLDTMDMVRAREAYSRWLGSERTSNPDRRIWEEILNRNPNVGIVKGEETLWGQDAADFFANNSDRITMGATGILFRPQEPRPFSQSTPPSTNPCPPNFLGIIKGGSGVTNAFNEAFKKAQETQVEHGGWVIMNRRGNLRSVLKARERSDHRTGVQLGYPERHMRLRAGEVIVASFHAHVDDVGPDDGLGGDIDINTNRDRVPGIIIRKSQVQGYGPKSGSWRSDLPSGCQ
jgi:YD repeat-containing protein